ncbi:MAG: hypothetical protein HOJ88_07080 [Proteobacteria bacterium]|jgi:hypothetical protein|nr:hypothetical protein [Pseudomonadota bacterium]
MKQLLIILLAVFLYACGGGDSTSGGGDSTSGGGSESTASSSGTTAASGVVAAAASSAPSTTPTSTPSSSGPSPSSSSASPSSSSSASPSSSSSASPSSLAGTYVGTASATISVGGGAITESFTEPFTVVIDENNLATVTVDGSSQTIAVSNGTVNLNIPFDEVEDDLRCVGTLQLALSIGSTAISGTITGSGTCNQSGLQADFVIENGTIAATRQ